MSKNRVFSDLLLAIFVIVIIAMLIIPLPTFLLDILIVVNISVSLLLLLVGLYMPNALALLSFPTLLLLTTLFRLGLNVASTRLILSQGHAGQVIQAFGTFLVRGEVLVGVIIFTIITIVNFIVIARGSSRVSVVAARFTLDSLPGKQAAIDADLRSGLISNDEAVRRREDLRKESQLYGAMDGSMQFVQGDAIAGFFIILTNIFGGLYLGMSKGQSFSDALNTYTVLTVGDGLVTQIPALLISICAGIVVTRVSSGERATLSYDLSSQLFSNPMTLVVAGVMLAFLGLLPGLPFLPFAFVAGMFLITSVLIKRSPVVVGEPHLLLDYKGSAGLKLLPRSVEAAEEVDQRAAVIYLDKNVGLKLYEQKEQEYRKFWSHLRDDFFSEVGLLMPEPRVLSDEYNEPLEYKIKISDLIIEQEKVLMDSVMLELNPDFSYLYSINVLKEAAHPVSGARVFWAENSEHTRQITEASGTRAFDFLQYVSLKLAAYYYKHPEELISISDVHSQLKLLEKRQPGIVADVLARNFLDIPRLTELLQLLVKNGVNVRDFKQVVENVASYCSMNSIIAQDVDSAVLSDIVLYIKSLRARRGGSTASSLKVLTLDDKTAAIFADHPLEELTNDYPDKALDLKNNLLDLLKPVYNKGLAPVAVLCPPLVKNAIEGFVDYFKVPIGIVTEEELGKSSSIEKIAVWKVVS